MVVGRRLALCALLLAAWPAGAAGQEWRVGAQLGRIDYHGALAAGGKAPAVILGVTRLAPSDYVGISAGLPVGEQQFWAAASALRRLPLGVGWLNLDLAAHGFAQRAPDSLRQSGGPLPLPVLAGEQPESWYVRGAGGQAALAVTTSLARTQLELRGGLAAQSSSIAGVTDQVLLPALDGRALLELGPVRFGPEAQQWSDEATYAGAIARLSRGGATAWGSAGTWRGAGPEGLTWSAGGAWDVAAGLRLEGSYRSAGYDPLYRAPTAGSVALGASYRLAGAPPVAPPIPAAYRDGRALIRIRTREVSGTPRIAGDFSDWKPLPMTRVGGTWEASVALAPGVYNYAFVTEAGDWFVPESVPGRRSDGMGGWQAVLVVE